MLDSEEFEALMCGAVILGYGTAVSQLWPVLTPTARYVFGAVFALLCLWPFWRICRIVRESL